MLNHQEILFKIAELCGWTHIESFEAGIYGFKNGEISSYKQSVPNYTESLDACREFEKDVDLTYFFNLAKIVGVNTEAAILNRRDILAMLNATPLQRNEAFLRWKGEWK